MQAIYSFHSEQSAINRSFSSWHAARRGKARILRRAAAIFFTIALAIAFGSSLAAAKPPQARAVNPSYLQSFPSVDQVMALKGKDASDTTLLQIGAFRQLQTMIQNLAGSRYYRHQLTPDEQRLIGDYSVAYEKLAHPLNYPDDYFGSAALLKVLATNFKMDAVISQWHQGGVAAAKKTNANLPPQPGAPGNGGGNSGGGTAPGPLRPIPPSNDPARAAIIRCLELGGSDLGCVGKGMGMGLEQMGAPNPEALVPTILGLRVIGVFNNPSSGLQLNFRDTAVTINGCKGLDLGPTVTYSVQPTAGQFAIQVNNVPKAFLAGLTNDDKMAGPASVLVTGKVITGYRLGTEYKVDSDGVTIPGTAHQVKTPIYSDKTVTCSIGSLVAGPPTLPDQGVVSSFADMLTLAAGTFSPIAQQAADKTMQQKGVPAGVRILGSYANSAGMKLQFAEGPVVVDCAQAHVSVPYAIAASGSSAAITVNNGATPFTVIVQPNGSLSGSGSATVTGRLMAGFDADNHPAYAPTSATCSIGALAPQK
ncbi:MAG TPA: hypothetical protein VFO34_06835 [Candidatus Acidoferrales bacterium]|nr:hypothetical protein [Candidatus Acidoferrales bacterium]